MATLLSRCCFPGSLLFAVLVVSQAGPAAGGEIGVGDAAPAFELMGSDGQRHSLAQHRGTRGVVIAWFPKAFTSG